MRASSFLPSAAGVVEFGGRGSPPRDPRRPEEQGGRPSEAVGAARLSWAEFITGPGSGTPFMSGQ